MATRPAAGGGRIVEVPPERLRRWLDNFAERHGGVPAAEPMPDGLRLVAADGGIAECVLPFGGSAADPDELVAAAERPRRIGLLLARRGAFGVGIADGPSLVTSKIERRYVQGRTAAGGWSQQRFARRRDNQARQSAGAAAEVAARVLLPELDSLVAVVLGGDRQAVDAVLADRRLGPVADKVGGWFLPVAEPRREVLADAVGLARQVHIRLLDRP